MPARWIEDALGRPAPEYALSIRDEKGNIVADESAGELCVKGVPGLSMFVAYVGDEAATTAAFTADGYFRTGDVVRVREDGALIFVDRTKDMLKVGGENVAASEIEAVIAEHPGVREVAVVARGHPFLLEVPVAFVIAADAGEPPSADELMALCQSRLTGFKQPRDVRFVEDLPRSMGGVKVRKADLRVLLGAEGAA